MLAVLPRRARRRSLDGPAPRVGVLVPAHNEETEIGATIESVRRQLKASDRLIVVADNCSDRTADVAARAGATVIERRSDERGKGYALAFGVDHLRADPPDIVVFVDADCQLEPGALDDVARTAAATGRPAQGLYLMKVPPNPGPKDLVSAFAFQLKNEVRAAGLAALSLPCHLTGTAMAWPWPTLSKVKLATGSIVEDLEFGLSLALAGSPAVLCPDACVTGRLPQRGDAARAQRRRWEHGSLQTAFSLAPKLLWHGIKRFDVGLLALALDVCVPPLSLLVMGVAASLVAVATLAALGVTDWRPAIVLGAALFAVVVAVLAGWLKFARRTLPLGSLLAIPVYLAWKLPIAIAFVVRREKRWVRTTRDDESRTEPQVDDRRSDPR